MNNQPPSFIDTVRETTPKDEHVNPPLDLSQEKTGHGCQPLLVNLVHPLCTHLCRPRRPAISVQLLLFSFERELLPRSNVWNTTREVPPLEYLLANVVAVVRAKQSLGDPLLLEERLARLREFRFTCFFANRSLVQVV